MSHASRRRGNRPRPCLRVETLEARALLAVAGSLDPSFGGGYGYTTVPTGVLVQSNAATNSGTIVEPGSVLTLSDGHIVVNATISAGNSTSNISAVAIEELNPNGTLDTSFGAGGLAVVPVNYYRTTFTMASQSNGQIILAGTNGSSVFRLNANGTLDTTFGTNGFFKYSAGTTPPLNDQLEAVSTVLPLPSGQIILAGNAFGVGAGLTTVELNSNGTIDTSYGTNGTSNLQIFGTGYDYATSGAALQANGQVVLTGNIEVPSTADFVDDPYAATAPVVIRLNANGTLDTTFANGGISLLPINPSNLAASGLNGALNLAVQPTTGDLLVEGAVSSYEVDDGFTQMGGGYVVDYYTVYALKPDGTLDTSFGTKGQTLPPVPSGSGLDNLAVQANGDILLAGSLQNVFLLRLSPNGSADATFGNTLIPGLLQTRLTSGEPDLAISPLNNDIISFEVSTIDALSGQTYGLTVDSILPVATTGPTATPPPALPPSSLAVYDPTSGSFVETSASTTSDTSPPYSFTYAFGPAGLGQTIPATADYAGFGYGQLGAYLPASGVYAIQPSATSPGLFVQFGMAGAGNSIPVPADYYGTGHDDVAVYMPLIASYAIMATDGQPARTVPFGIPGTGQSIPAPADYYNTGQDDLAVYLAQAGAFAILAPGGATGEIIPFGAPGLGVSYPVPGDYDGSGKTELAVYIPALGAFYYRPANGGPDVKIPIGTANSGEIPVPGDYDGSGRTEAAIYDPKGGFIEYQPAKGGPVVINYIGTANDGSIPLAAPPGDLPEFAAKGLGSAASAVRAESVPAVASGSVAMATITSSSPQAVPAGPTLASARVARSLINQAAPDPFEPL